MLRKCRVGYRNYRSDLSAFISNVEVLKTAKIILPYTDEANNIIPVLLSKLEQFPKENAGIDWADAAAVLIDPGDSQKAGASRTLLSHSSQLCFSDDISKDSPAANYCIIALQNKP